MPDPTYSKKHKSNPKKECKGSACINEKPPRHIFDVFKGGGKKKNKPSESPLPSKKWTSPPEKVGYQAGTAHAGEPMQTKPEVSGTGMSKEKRKSEEKKYKTRY